jgi:hypothetical protein
MFRADTVLVQLALTQPDLDSMLIGMAGNRRATNGLQTTVALSSRSPLTH